MAAVSIGWILNLLGGMKFPESGQAYNYVKLHIEADPSLASEAVPPSTSDPKPSPAPTLWAEIYAYEYKHVRDNGGLCPAAAEWARARATEAMHHMNADFEAGFPPPPDSSEDVAARDALAACRVCYFSDPDPATRQKVASETLSQLRIQGFRVRRE
jgi:hypothetical protein